MSKRLRYTSKENVTNVSRPSISLGLVPTKKSPFRSRSIVGKPVIESFVTAVHKMFLLCPTGVNYRLKEFFTITPVRRLLSEGAPGLQG